MVKPAADQSRLIAREIKSRIIKKPRHRCLGFLFVVGLNAIHKPRVLLLFSNNYLKLGVNYFQNFHFVGSIREVPHNLIFFRITD